VSQVAMGDHQGHSHRWRSWIWAINLLFVACTVYASAKWPHGRHLQYFNLGPERTLGTWWSAMQLLLFGLLAHSIALEAESARARRAWFLLAVTGMALFADETASIHEHLWVARWGLVPIAAVFLIALVYSIHMLRSEEERYGNAWRWLVRGFALFALVYPLEVAEDQFRFPLLWQRALRTGVEEGVELAGMFALLAAAATARQRIGQPTPWLPRPSSLRLAIGLGAGLAALLAANVYSVATPFSAPVALTVCYLASLAAAAGVLHFASREAALVGSSGQRREVPLEELQIRQIRRPTG